MTDRPDYDRRRQRTVLTKLRKNAGMEIQDVALAVRLSYPQTVRYLDGRTPLHSFRIATFAKAFGVDPLDLAAELGGQDILEDQLADPDKPVWSFRDALRQGGIPEPYIDALAREWEGRPVVNQQSAVERILWLAERRRAEAWPHNGGSKSHTA